MSALDRLRQVMVTSRDLFKDYDSDAVSLASTAVEEEGEYYTSDCIVAEDSKKQNCYLVSWEAYPLDQCTWEPPWHLDGTTLIETWNKLKRELGTAAFQRENKANIEAYDEAYTKAQAIRDRRHEKRQRERRRLERRKRTVVSDDESSDEGPPLAELRRESLFVRDQTPSTQGSPALAPPCKGPPPVSRRPPLLQSSSEDESASEGGTLGHPLTDGPRDGSTRPKDPRSAVKKATSGSVPPKRKPETSASTRTSTAPSLLQNLEQRPTVSPAFTVARSGITAASSVSTKSKARETTTSNTMRAIRTAQPKQPHCAIAFIDEPKEKQKRQWSTNQQYTKLRYRGLADKRSRTEAVPDFSVLSFMHGPPPTLPKATVTQSNDNPYGRRETATHRVQKEHMGEVTDRLRRESRNATVPLAAWEADKVPLVCFHWKTLTCPRTARECRFMHRDTNPEGEPYQIGDFDGRIPHKYHNPPITCLYWYKGGACSKTAEECLYAHWDTGWADINGVPTEIDRVRRDSFAPVGSSHSKPPHPQTTCSFWLWNPKGCSKSAEECKYAHRNTGWARPEFEPQGQPTRIDPDLKPRHEQPKDAKPPLTCPFWLRAERGCTEANHECSYAHWNTGWVPPSMGNGLPSPIDPRILPFRQVNKNGLGAPSIAPLQTGNTIQTKKDLTCSFWLRDPQGCSRSEDACAYAHRNTGWAISKDKPLGPPVPLDPNQIPRYRRELGKKLEPKYRDPSITCSAWLQGKNGCSESDEACVFAHRDTGWIIPNGRTDGACIPISRAVDLRHNSDVHEFADVAPKFATPPVTCFFWLKGSNGCAKSAANCRFAHKNTGWFSAGPGQNHKPPQRIDPRALPWFPKFDPTEAAKSKDIQTELAVPSLSRPVDELMSVHVPTDDTNGAVQIIDTQQTQDAIPREMTAVPTLSQIRSKIERIYNLDINQMFYPPALGDEKPLERHAMLLYDPEEHPEEMELITRWLLLHNVRVANLWYGGAWSQFREDIDKHKSGVVIVHPDFEHYVELPGFGDILKQRVRVWSVGLQPPADFIFGMQSIPDKLSYECVGLFPHGGLIYITDDVFEQKPQLALSIVKLFFAKIEQLRHLDGPDSWWLKVDDAYLLWRLCVRPELMEYLYFKCRDNSEELAAGNPDYLSRADLYSLLTLTDYVEQDNPVVPLSTVHDKYPILSHRRELAEDPSINYFNILESNQEEANTQMVGHYAAMHSVLLRCDYRHFYVVHTEPKATCAKQWKADIHTITDIITPEDCINELSKPSKDSLFDFMDWALKPKDPDSTPAEADLGDTPVDISHVDEIQEVEHTAY